MISLIAHGQCVTVLILIIIHVWGHTNMHTKRHAMTPAGAGRGVRLRTYFTHEGIKVVPRDRDPIVSLPGFEICWYLVNS